MRVYLLVCEGRGHWGRKRDGPRAVPPRFDSPALDSSALEGLGYFSRGQIAPRTSRARGIIAPEM
eukprot:2584724-Lingulodinium_polyedra.AAC.1